MADLNTASDDVIDDVVRQARRATGEDAFEHYKHELDRYSNDLQTTLQERPLTVLGAAIFIGFALGAVWKA